MEIEQNEPVPVPFDGRTWGKLEWTGWCTGGTIYVGCTEAEYKEWTTDSISKGKDGDVAEWFNAPVLKTDGV